jgi:hypothetical protein
VSCRHSRVNLPAQPDEDPTSNRPCTCDGTGHSFIFMFATDYPCSADNIEFRSPRPMHGREYTTPSFSGRLDSGGYQAITCIRCLLFLANTPVHRAFAKGFDSLFMVWFRADDSSKSSQVIVCRTAKFTSSVKHIGRYARVVWAKARQVEIS